VSTDYFVDSVRSDNFRYDYELRLGSNVSVWQDAAVGAYGERVRQLRKAAGLGPAVAARRIGIKPTTLQQLEDGTTTQVQQGTKTKIGRFFGVDPDTLLPIVSAPSGQTDAIEAIQPGSESVRLSPFETNTKGTVLPMDSPLALRAAHLVSGLPAHLQDAAVERLLDYIAETRRAAGNAARTKDGG
jgi:transcriptional regulator with XRE-family HTH domain